MHPAYDARPMASGRRARAPRLLNRELSWLDFNARVLALAEDERTPLLERVKFTAIFATNLDEFFMVRVAGLQRQVAGGVTVRSPDGLRPAELLEAVLERAAELAARHARAWSEAFVPALAHAGIRIARWSELGATERTGLAGLFAARVFPVLTPLAVDPAHPFPFISNRSLNLAVRLRDPAGGEERFARIKVPPILERFVNIGQPDPSAVTLLPMEELIGGNLERLFRGMEVIGRDTFRVTRDAISPIDDDDAEDLLRHRRGELRRARRRRRCGWRSGRAARPRRLALLGRELGLAAASSMRCRAAGARQPVGAASGSTVRDLKDPPFSLRRGTRAPADLQGEVEIFERLDAGEASRPPPVRVVRGQRTGVHRAGRGRSAGARHQADALPHHRRPRSSTPWSAPPRPASRSSCWWSSRPASTRRTTSPGRGSSSSAGCHVVYGVSGLKTHAKLVLVVRRDGEAIRRYVHVGTGNYNAATARVYEDLGLLSADPLLAREVGELFNLLSGYAHRAGAERVMVAPFDLRHRLLARIAAEADVARAGHAGADRRQVQRAHRPGAHRGAVRGERGRGRGGRRSCAGSACCAPAPGERSAPIRVRSILGRFLEHSRIYQFGVAPATEAWIGSADLMERNLDRRVEVLVRIDDEAQRLRLAASSRMRCVTRRHGRSAPMVPGRAARRRAAARSRRRCSMPRGRPTSRDPRSRSWPPAASCGAARDRGSRSPSSIARGTTTGACRRASSARGRTR